MNSDIDPKLVAAARKLLARSLLEIEGERRKSGERPPIVPFRPGMRNFKGGKRQVEE